MGILDAVLDNWGNWSSDTNQNRANDSYVNALAAGLLSGRSNNFGVNLGHAMGGANQARGAELDRAMKEALSKAQIANFGSEDMLRRAQAGEMQRKGQVSADQMRVRQSVFGQNAPDASGTIPGASLPNGFDFKAASAAQNAGVPQPAPTRQRIPTLSDMMKLQSANALDPQDLQLYEKFQPQERKPGSFYQDPVTQQTTFTPDVKSGIGFENNRVQPLPGATETQAGLAGAVERATQAAKAPYSVSTIPGAGPGGGPLTMRNDVLAQGQPGQGARPDVSMNGNPEVMRHVFEVALKTGIRPDVALRLIGQESGWNPSAVSPKGAQGLGQLMPGTAQELGVNPGDWKQNVEGSMKYLRQQLDANQGDYSKALAAYNAGPGRVAKAGGVPNIPETQDYVARIMSDKPTGQAGVFPGANPVTADANKAVAGDAIKMLGSSKEKASAAADSIRTIQDLSGIMEDAKSKNRVLVGPSTKWREAGLALASTLGFTGKDAEQWLGQRAQIVQGAAAMAIKGAAAVAGQGAISNYEREAIQLATSPNQDKMTYVQMQAALSGIEKANRWEIEKHNKQLKNTNAEWLGQGGADVYKVDAPHSKAENQTKANADVLNEAKNALLKGASRDAVVKRLESMGITGHGL